MDIRLKGLFSLGIGHLSDSQRATDDPHLGEIGDFMEKTKVYDLPTRLFHWLFASLFIGAFAIAKLVDDDSPWFSQHMIFGLILFVVTSLRVIWGVVGSRYARFSSYPLHPLQLLKYFRDILSSKGSQYYGHNPASAWSALAMMLLALGLGATGYLMATGQKETFEDIHELFANGFAFVVVAHVAGVVLHSLRHRDGIALSMIHGKKVHTEDALPITSSHRWVAIGMAGIVGVFAFQLYSNYDAARATTSVFGLSLQIGEGEGESGGDGGEDGEGHSRGEQKGKEHKEEKEHDGDEE